MVWINACASACLYHSDTVVSQEKEEGVIFACMVLVVCGKIPLVCSLLTHSLSVLVAAGSSNGRTDGSEPSNSGSNPGPAMWHRVRRIR